MKPTFTNNMHITKGGRTTPTGKNGIHPFPLPMSGGNSRPLAKMVGIGQKPGGNGDKISANAAMRTRPKGGMTGPGEA